MPVTSRIRRQGGAAVVTIPPALLKLMDVDVGAQVALSISDGKLVAQPIKSGRRRYTLAELLKGADEMKRLNAEVSWAQDGEPVGRELG